MPIKTHRRFITCSLAALALTFVCTPEARAETPPEDIGYDGDGAFEHENRPMMYTGIALTTTGLVGLGAGSAVVAWVANDSTNDDVRTIAVATSIIVPSSILVHIGIPLWAVGAASPDPEVLDEEERASAVPEFRINGTGGSLRWRF